MKKVLKILLLLALYFNLNIGVKAATYEVPVEFTLMETFYTDVTKTTSGGRTIFDLTNNLNSMDLTPAQLQSILDYKADDPTSHLAVYETLNIKVNPVTGTPYESLTGKDTYYLGATDEHWEDADNITLSADDTAKVHNLNSNVYPWGLRVVYRLNPTDEYIETPPTDSALDNKTIEEQLATLLSIDLVANPNGVVDQYKTLYDFDTLTNDFTSTVRYDLYDTDPAKQPVLIEGTDDTYDPSSLKLLGTEYVVIRYNSAPDEAPASGENDDEDNDSEVGTWIFILGGTALIGAGVYYYLKRIKKII